MLSTALARAAASVAGILLTATACGTGSPAAAPSTPPVSATTDHSPLEPLVELSVSRIKTADEVSAAKFGTPSPIDDPAREQQVIAAASAKAQTMQISPEEVTRFFRDQIEANKVVQRGLYQQWTSHPDQRPGTKPDLATVVRPELDRLTDQIMDSLKATVPARHAGAGCTSALRRATEEAGRHLDQLHQQALTVATGSVCTG
ncbi:chorismate mutase [Pseudonocardia spinosispora]|uniref:chorismate mutase n=1 Tax=Pseudonocardia spinosispora TaxID=103441 RepID=UPI000490A350|nr:chorismate mutase [Pseudonocardia spinosispora]